MRFRSFCCAVIAFSILACSVDDKGESSSVHQHVAAQRVLTSAELPDVMNFVRDRLGSDLQLSLHNDRSNASQSIEVGELNTERILVLNDEHNRSSYSFSFMDSAEEGSGSFLSFVVKETAGGYYGYVVEYTPDPQWRPSGQNPEFMTEYTGDIAVYTDQGYYVASSTFTSGTEVGRDVVEECNSSGGTQGGNNGGQTGQNGNQGDPGDQGSNQGDQNTGGHNIDINVVCGCPPMHAGGSSNPSCTCTLADVITITINARSIQQSLRSSDPCAEVCFAQNGDPCPFGCDADGSCAPDPNEGENEGVAIDFGVFLALGQLAGPNDHFVYPAEHVDPSSALHFESVEAFEEYLNDKLLEQQFPVIVNQDGTHTTRFRIRHGMVVPRDVTVWIRQQLETTASIYQIVELETDYSGITLGTSWTQQQYDYSVQGSIATINLYGTFSYNLFIEDVGTIFTDNKHYQMQVNTVTGEPVSIVELNY